VGGKTAKFVKARRRLVFDGLLRPSADDQMGFHLGIRQHFKKPDTENSAARTGHPYNKSFHDVSCSSRVCSSIRISRAINPN
jgi:hypothetical protein